MKIIFDHQIFEVQAFGGFTKYFISLLRSLRQIPGLEVDLIAPAHVNEYIEVGDSNSIFTFRLRRPRKGLNYRPRIVAPLFRALASIQRPDLIHETHFRLSGSHLPAGVPVIATCHDMIQERHSDGSAFAIDTIARKKAALERARAIICISENTRRELLDWYPRFENKVSVVHHGVDHVMSSPTPNVTLPDRYLLYVGVRTGYKNFERVVRAIGTSTNLRGNIGLVCFGGGKLTAEEHKLLSDLGLDSSKVVQLAGNESQLAHVYENAVALVYPSISEGFGMPLTEAMVQGCPVVCSQTSCFPEICADAAEYFDPNDIDSIRSSIELIVENVALREDLIRLGRDRAKFFTWQRCAADTAQVYASVR
jgi:glycosyltransferase involved in cell wall biosynthesis